MPAAQHRGHFRVQVRGVVTVAVAGVPDHALQRLERGVLAVLVDPALQRLDDDLVLAGAGGDLGGDGIEPAAHLRLLAMRAHEAGQGGAGIGEQHFLDEGDAGGGAFDVGEDGACGHAGVQFLLLAGAQLGRIATLHGEAARRVRHRGVPDAGARRAEGVTVERGEFAFAMPSPQPPLRAPALALAQGRSWGSEPVVRKLPLSPRGERGFRHHAAPGS